MRLAKINMAVQLICVFAFAHFCGHLIPLAYKAGFLAASQSLLEILLFLLPFFIISCLFYSLVANQGRAFGFILILFIVVCFSNLLSLLAAYGFGLAGLSFHSLNLHKATQNLNILEPLWNLKLPTLLGNDQSLMVGAGLGLFFSVFRFHTIEIIAEKSNKLVVFLLSKLFVPVLPIFAFGFILKMQHEGILGDVLFSYFPIVGLVFICNVIYVMLMFLIAAKFKKDTFYFYLKNVVSPGILAFSSMSSLATMPLNLEAAEKNTRNPLLSRAVIPATVNIHMIGDSITTPIVIMAIMVSFGHPLPSFSDYWVFVEYYMLAKFAVPGVPCGPILILIPIIENHLGFDAEMSAFLTAIYILFDPILTTGNVLGNGALTIILTRIMQFFSSDKDPSLPVPKQESTGEEEVQPESA